MSKDKKALKCRRERFGQGEEGVNKKRYSKGRRVSKVQRGQIFLKV